MASSARTSTTPARRKSTKGSMVVTLKVSPKLLQTFEPATANAKEESQSQDSRSALASVFPVGTSSNDDNPSKSNSNTPVPIGTPVPTSMPPPTEGVKKRGVKRGGPVLGPDGLPKPRGKPGPKKKARLEDGTIDYSASAPRAANGAAAHKLGPKANQGAINAGLRALDRSGTPCRKWQKGGFRLKSFTGVIWELPRWKAPPKNKADGNPEESTSGDSSKENKDNSQIESEKSEKSNSGADVEMGSTANASSPAPSVPVVTAALTSPSAPVVPATA